MRRTTNTVILVLALASFGAHAEDTPEWDRVKACFDINLATLLRSNEPIKTVFMAARAICDDAIDDALEQTFASIKEPKTSSELLP